MRRKPQLLSSHIVASTRVFQVEQMELRFSNGVEVQYERILGARNGAVLVAPVNQDNEVLLVREYAAGIGRYELGFPKGLIEADENALEAADRELQEEVGYAARTLEHLRSMTVAPGYFDFVTDLVLARDLYEQRLQGDEPERLQLVTWPLADLTGLLRHPELNEARSIAALFLLRDRLLHE